MKLIALETATEACSAALYSDGETLERYSVQPRGHADLILGMVDELLSEAGLRLRELDALAFGRGPGAFTGVRIAVGVIQGLAFGADLPVVPVSTLQALAQGAFREQGHGRVLAAIDARMGEVYWGAFTEGPSGLLEPAGEEGVFRPEAVPLPTGSDWFGAGSGWNTYPKVLARHPGRDILHDGERLPRARDIAALAIPMIERGEGLPAEKALPVYLRDQVVRKPA
ncbi:tRNA (adenosine(37)-N6)-threonylcarbamoyltransferase complex dimerization subunit type 1 TsaB [Thiohalomonas denitrificans]|uniref:tRNA (adenosine(37)-N6)-threonylcarbamoyltransferase complex dimerization subunit type 1 TsaB n=1 Tax=Thiohalomonas denitrificans TaxID=415747 RepID=UPI0026EF35AE|nr:tRNA (adenosine(37)-N6)-threonylcarbamoyltransferase complex dimerization subunit type 1 TsaB [Thiohalomonas denitrificans]